MCYLLEVLFLRNSADGVLIFVSFDMCNLYPKAVQKKTAHSSVGAKISNSL